jgi:NADPH:quinone reductase
MRAIAYAVTGRAAEVLRLLDLPVVEPGPGEIRVRIAVSGVNPTDWKARAGSAPGLPLAFDAVVPNQDGAGTVDAIGPGSSAFRVGDRVWIWDAAWRRPGGTAAEYVVIDAEHVVALPDSASFDVGASLGIPALTAHRTLTVLEDGPRNLGPGTMDGRFVLVAGGAGAVGHAAIQLARWSGATVITTVSSDAKAALARAAGADHVLNYREQDVVADIKAITKDGVDIIVEVAPGPNAALDAAVLAAHGTIAVYATDGGDSVHIPVREHMIKNSDYRFVMTYTTPAAAKARAVQDVTAAAGAGALEVGAEAGLPLHRFDLADTALAHDAVAAGVVGKVLIDI